MIGGTGELGRGLATRFSGPENQIAIGSRDPAKARDAASRVVVAPGGTVEGRGNEDAASWCEVAVLTIPDLPSDETLLSLKSSLAGKLVISPIVPMKFIDGLFFPALSSESAAERVASVLQTKVAAAFHTLSGPRLLRPNKALNSDVLVAADSVEIYSEVAAIVSKVNGLRPLYAGPLRNARMLEMLTPMLLNVGKLNKILSPSIKVL